MKDPINSGLDIPDSPHYQIHIYTLCNRQPQIYVYNSEKVWLDDLKQAHNLYSFDKNHIIKAFHIEYTAYTESPIVVHKRWD